MGRGIRVASGSKVGKGFSVDKGSKVGWGVYVAWGTGVSIVAGSPWQAIRCRTIRTETKINTLNIVVPSAAIRIGVSYQANPFP